MILNFNFTVKKIKMNIENLLALSVAPIVIILFYIYFRDKYEKEPIKILSLAFLAGALTTIPIYFIEVALSELWETNLAFRTPFLATAAFKAFAVASFTEEAFKFAVFFLVIWKNKNFNEKFDGIVYATFISLGFATIENILYVFNHGLEVGLLRAVTAVPAHALFGISMGYYLGFAKMLDYNKTKNIFAAFFIAFLLHGIYDFILFSQKNYLLIVFIPFVVIMFVVGFRKMKKHSDNSIFKNNDYDFEN